MKLAISEFTYFEDAAKNRILKIKQILTCILTGAASALASTNNTVALTIPLSLTIFIILLNKCKELKIKYIFSYAYSFGFVLISSYWIIYPLTNLINIPFFLSLIILLILSAIIANIFALPFFIHFYSKRFLSIAFLTIASEFIRLNTFLALPWTYYGNICINIPIIKNALPLGGIFLSGYLLILFCEYIAKIYTDKILHNYTFILLTGIIFVLNISTFTNITSKSKEHTFTILQGNLSPKEKNQIEKTWQIYSQMLSKSDTKSLKILPEGVINTYFYNLKEKEQLQTSSLLKDSIIGIAYNLDSKNFISMLGSGEVKGEHIKEKLVPFGEYIPFSEDIAQFLPEAKNIFPKFVQTNEIGKYNLEYKNIKIYPFICYELFFPSAAKKAQIKADINIAIAENSWYENSIVQKQLLNAAKIRAKESGKSLILSMNKGLSAVIDNYGNIKKISKFNTKGIYNVNIQIKKEISLYQFINDFSIIGVIFIIELLLIVFREILKNEHNIQPRKS